MSHLKKAQQAGKHQQGSKERYGASHAGQHHATQVPLYLAVPYNYQAAKPLHSSECLSSCRSSSLSEFHTSNAHVRRGSTLAFIEVILDEEPLVAMPFVPSSFLLPVVLPGATSSGLVTGPIMCLSGFNQKNGLFRLAESIAHFGAAVNCLFSEHRR